MKSPWVNTLLLIILIVQLTSGYLGLINNEESLNWVLWLHGIGAYAIVLMIYWKGTVIFDAFRRKKVWTLPRIIFVFTLILLVTSLALGFLWTFSGPSYFLRISTVSWHIYISVLLMALMLWHAWKMRFIFRLPAAKDRKLFLRLGIFSIGGLATWALAGESKKRFKWPGAFRRFTGSYPIGLESGRFPVVSWINDRTPKIDLDRWRLSIGGAVQKPMELSYEQLRAMPRISIEATLDCTGGWYTTQTWQGISLSGLLADAGLNSEAASITVRSLTGYNRRFSLEEANRYLVALDLNDNPLPAGHGFPIRLVPYDKRGVEWVKWISAIEVNRTSKYWQSPLPLQ